MSYLVCPARDFVYLVPWWMFHTACCLHRLSDLTGCPIQCDPYTGCSECPRKGFHVLFLQAIPCIVPCRSFHLIHGISLLNSYSGCQGHLVRNLAHRKICQSRWFFSCNSLSSAELDNIRFNSAIRCLMQYLEGRCIIKTNRLGAFMKNISLLWLGCIFCHL